MKMADQVRRSFMTDFTYRDRSYTHLPAKEKGPE